MLRTRLPAHQLLGITEEQWIEMGYASTIYDQLVEHLLEEQKQT